jgi:hypothetical protein
MDQLKKYKSKHNRPDTPLAPTPEPQYTPQAQASRDMNNRIINEARDSRLKNSSQQAIEQSKANKAAESAMKEARDKQANDALNNLSGSQEPYNNSRGENRNSGSSLLNRR